MEQLVAIVAVWRLAILKRMPAAPLTLLLVHRVREQMKVQVQRSGKMKTWGGSGTQRANILNSEIVFWQNSTCPFGPFRPTRNAYAYLTERKRQWEVCEALNAINHQFNFVNRNITAYKIWTKADTGRERQLDSFLI